MKLIVECPAKINLTLKVFKKDETTGFHPIESIMQSVSLCDYLAVETINTKEILLSGNSNEIAYDENNLVYKACQKFLKTAKTDIGIKIHIEKNIPVAAGLAGGSADAAGIILALNTILDNKVSNAEIFDINSSLGSDLNFCYKGGRSLASGKGDNLTPLEFIPSEISIVKPKNLKISTKDAYNAFDLLKERSNLKNDLEFAMLPYHEELQILHNLGFQMSGSGPSFFINKAKIPYALDKSKYEIFENLTMLNHGVRIV